MDRGFCNFDGTYTVRFWSTFSAGIEQTNPGPKVLSLNFGTALCDAQRYVHSYLGRHVQHLVWRYK